MAEKISQVIDQTVIRYLNLPNGFPITNLKHELEEALKPEERTDPPNIRIKYNEVVEAGGIVYYVRSLEICFNHDLNLDDCRGELIVGATLNDGNNGYYRPNVKMLRFVPQ